MNPSKIHLADRQRAIVEAGRLIDLLADESPDVQTIKDHWRSLGRCIRAAIAEIRQAEQRQTVYWIWTEKLNDKPLKRKDDE